MYSGQDSYKWLMSPSTESMYNTDKDGEKIEKQ